MTYLKGGYNLLDLGNLFDTAEDFETLESFDAFIISKERFNELYTKMTNGKPCLLKARVYDANNICDFVSIGLCDFLTNALVDETYVIKYNDIRENGIAYIVFGKLKDGRYFLMNDNNSR